MNYRRLGDSGLRVSELGFGAWVTFGSQIGDETATDLMRTAYEAGINYFDNAESYAEGRAEIVMGNVLKRLGWARSSYVISTKFYWGLEQHINVKWTLNRKYLTQALEGSLKRLQLDYVDLILCHRPDPNTPIEETVWAMHDLVQSGKALYWGTSEWSAYEILSALTTADKHHLRKPVVEQTQYNLLTRERVEKEYARLFREYHYGELAWSPLASGVLSGKYRQGTEAGSRRTQPGLDWLHPLAFTQARIEKVQELEPIAQELGCSLAQMAIAWCLKNENISSVLLGASGVKQLQENLAAPDIALQLTPEILGRIDKVMGNKPPPPLQPPPAQKP